MFLLNYDTNPDSRFSGNSEYFKFTGKNSTVQIKALNIKLNTSETKEIELLYVKNIKVDDNIQDNRESFKIRFNEGYQLFSNGTIDVMFRNLSMVRGIRDYRWIGLQGFLDKTYPNKIKGEIILEKPHVNNISIWNETAKTWNEMIKDFKKISFELDDQSSVMFISDNIDLKAYQTSDLQIPFSEISYLLLLETEGKFKLNNHRFDINSADKLEIRNIHGRNKSEDTYFHINDKKITFAGYTNNVYLNDKSIIFSDFYYWLDFQPDIINGYGVLTATILAILSLYISLWEKKNDN
jgi:hypothetical protein